MKTFLGVTAALFIACGGTTTGDDASTGDGGSSEAGGDGGDLSGQYACGKLICNTGEYCVHPCCGGAPPMCMPLPEAGTCPAGTMLDPTCAGNFGQGCKPLPCTPSPPFCAVKDACIGGTTQKRDAYCLCG